MTANGWLQIAVFTALVLASVKPLGLYMSRIFAGERTFLSPILAPLERLLYGAAGLDPKREQSWSSYAFALLAFNAAGFVALYALLRLQGYLPLNPAGFDGVPPALAFNTAISFVTNTNWQAYGGETTMSLFSQMVGLTVQNFLSAATGIAVALAAIRGFSRASAKTLGNFWVDVTRATLYLLLPLSIVVALALVALGVPQTFSASTEATTLEGIRQVIAHGPVASQLAIKQIGTNGGGFFNTNSAHPFENPSALTNLIELWAIFAIGAALTYTFGRAVKDTRQGWALLAAMGVLFFAGLAATYWAESAGNPAFAALGLDTTANMEGKETRFGIVGSALWAVVTTAASCGAVNAMHDSFTPLGGLVPLINMQLGEIVIGGVGAGLYGMLLFVLVAIFVAGLMVGRTPEYVGKKIEAREVKLAMLAILASPFAILGFTALASVLPVALASLANQGPHGFSEFLYAYTSAAANNGSAFAGLNANTPFFNTTLGIGMFVGRFLIILPVLAISGHLAAKAIVPASSGTFPTTGGLWVGLLVGVILIVGGLTFLPSLALGPIAEHLALLSGQTF